MLRNPIYLGLIKQKKETYPGEHPAIIDRETWEKVQMQLGENIQGKRRKARVTKESLFTGMLFDSTGTRYTPTHANKCGRRYRYYTSQAVIKKTNRSDAPGRIPAPDIEKEVIDRILAWLQAPPNCLLRFKTIRPHRAQRDSLHSSLKARLILHKVGARGSLLTAGNS